GWLRGFDSSCALAWVRLVSTSAQCARLVLALVSCGTLRRSGYERGSFRTASRYQAGALRGTSLAHPASANAAPANAMLQTAFPPPLLPRALLRFAGPGLYQSPALPHRPSPPYIKAKPLREPPYGRRKRAAFRFRNRQGRRRRGRQGSHKGSREG